MSIDPTVSAIQSQLSQVPDPVALLAGLFAVAPVGFQIYKADGHCLLVNPAFRTLFGTEPPPEYNVLRDEIAAKTGVQDLILRAFAGETIRLPPTWYDPRELQQVKITEGRKVAIEATFFPVRDAAGRVSHVAAVFADRTEIETERDLLHAIIQQSAEGIIVADAAGNIKMFNPAAQRQHGVNETDVPAERWADTFGLCSLDGTKLPLDETPLHQALHGRAVEDARWLVRRPDGEKRTLAGSAAPLRNRDGTAAGAVLVSRDETERYAFEWALRRSEERYRGIVAALAEGITIQDRDGLLVEANASAERLLGLRLDEMRGRTSSSDAWRALDENGVDLPGEHHPPMIALRTGEPQTNVVMGVERPDGKRIWLSVNAQPLFQPGTKERAGVVSSFFDITAQREAAEERTRLLAFAKAGEAQFRTLADTMPVLAWYAEPDGFIPWYNKRWYEYTGKPLDEQAGWQWQSVHDPDDLPRVVAKWKASLESGAPFEDQFRLRRGDGVFRWFLTRVEPLRDEAGRIIRWFGTNVDIEDQKRAERSLRILAEAGIVLGASPNLPTILQNVARLVVPLLGDWSALFLGERDGTMRLAAAAHVDHTKEALIHGFFPEHSAADARFGPQRVLQTGKSELWRRGDRSDARHWGTILLPEELQPNAAIVVPLTVTGRTFGALMLVAGESSAVYGSEDVLLAEELGRRVALAIEALRLLELTQRERVRAEEANRAKDEFLSVASHELRTPLNAILGWSRMLRSGAVPDERKEQAIQTIERNAKAQVQLVEDILDVSRIITGKLRLDIGPMDPAQIVEAAMDVVRPAADAKSVRLQALVDRDAGTVMGDAGRLQQVVWNLLANAVKFTPRGGRVHVRLRREDSHIELVVADTGQGIEPEFLPHLFEPFRQADGSSTRAHGGLGLGLAIVKHLVELHGGLVEAHSDGAATGATFTVRIPIAPVRSHLRAPAIAAVEGSSQRNERLSCPPQLNGLRILVVDDEPDARDLLQSILEQCSAKVRTAGSTSQALDEIRREPPHVILSDIGMPHEDGYDLIRKIRALPAEQGGRIPAVAITAYARTEDRTHALMEGFTSHVAKPVEPQELLAVIGAVVGAHPRH